MSDEPIQPKTEILFDHYGSDSMFYLMKKTNATPNARAYYYLVEKMSDGSGEFFNESISEKTALRLKTWLERIRAN